MFIATDTQTSSKLRCFPGRLQGGLGPGTCLLRPGPPRNRATSRALTGRSAGAARPLQAMGQNRQKLGKNYLLTTSAQSGRVQHE